METALTGEMLWERMVDAVEAVRDRLRRVTAALTEAEIDHAVVGGNAVAAWVARVDPVAVRNTQDVDILVRRSDFLRIQTALESAGFVFRHAAGIDMFLDGGDAGPRDAVHLVYANEKVRAEHVEPAPDVVPYAISLPFHLIPLEALVRMKLIAFRRKDQVHLQDLIQIGLIDATWPDRFPAVLAERLREILATPDG